MEHYTENIIIQQYNCIDTVINKYPIDNLKNIKNIKDIKNIDDIKDIKCKLNIIFNDIKNINEQTISYNKNYSELYIICHYEIPIYIINLLIQEKIFKQL